MQKSILYISIIFILIACEDSNKRKLSGTWAVVRYEHYVNGVQEPSTEWNEHWFFDGDTLRTKRKNFDYSFPSAFSVTKDSILFDEGNAYCYSFKSDTLVISETSEDYCLETYKLYLTRISEMRYGIWPKQTGLLGDWRSKGHTSTHKDSLNIEAASHYFKDDSGDLVISKDSVFSFNYPYYFNKVHAYTIKEDTMVTEGQNGTLNYHYHLNGDTLIRSILKPDNYLIRQTLVRTDFDQGNVDFLRKKIINYRFYYGEWRLFLYGDKSRKLSELCPDYRPMKVMSFVPPCSEQSGWDVSFDKDYFEVHAESGSWYFRFSTLPMERLGGCIPTTIVNVVPIYEGEEIPITLSYRIEQ